MTRPRIVSWFSCGTASAVNTKLVIRDFAATHDVAVARCIVPEEHPDNDRFAKECETWFGQPVINLRSEEYESCNDVWRKRRYMSGTRGAPCTIEMKKAVRWAFEQSWHPDIQAFGFTVEETARTQRFRSTNPEVHLVSRLIDLGITKAQCHQTMRNAGLEIPAMYRLGFPNANCVGCVKAQSPFYWNRVRRFFPEVFVARATLSRELGVKLVKGTRGARPRYFLDELDASLGSVIDEPMPDCDLLCIGGGS